LNTLDQINRTAKLINDCPKISFTKLQRLHVQVQQGVYVL